MNIFPSKNSKWYPPAWILFVLVASGITLYLRIIILTHAGDVPSISISFPTTMQNVATNTPNQNFKEYADFLTNLEKRCPSNAPAQLDQCMSNWLAKDDKEILIEISDLKRDTANIAVKIKASHATSSVSYDDALAYIASFEKSWKSERDASCASSASSILNNRERFIVMCQLQKDEQNLAGIYQSRSEWVTSALKAD